MYNSKFSETCGVSRCGITFKLCNSTSSPAIEHDGQPNYCRCDLQHREVDDPNTVKFSEVSWLKFLSIPCAYRNIESWSYCEIGSHRNCSITVKYYRYPSYIASATCTYIFIWYKRSYSSQYTNFENALVVSELFRYGLLFTESLLLSLTQSSMKLAMKEWYERLMKLGLMNLSHELFCRFFPGIQIAVGILVTKCKYYCVRVFQPGPNASLWLEAICPPQIECKDSINFLNYTVTMYTYHLNAKKDNQEGWWEFVKLRGNSLSSGVVTTTIERLTDLTTFQWSFKLSEILELLSG
jgi:hypothetical protein